MARIARRDFHYLSRCAPGTPIEIGDGRLLLLLHGRSAWFDVLAVDAFSSDAIPFHLLTREAMRGYD